MPIVGRSGLPAAQFLGMLAVAQDRGPAARSRVAEAGAVGDQLHFLHPSCASRGRCIFEHSAPGCRPDPGEALRYPEGLARTRRSFLAACAALPCLRAGGGIGAAEYARRRQALAGRVGRGVIALLGSTESEGRSGFTGFRQESNFFYLTGHEEPGAALLIAPARGRSPYREILFLGGASGPGAKWSGPSLRPEDAGHLGFAEVLAASEFRRVARALLRERGALASLFHAVPDNFPRALAARASRGSGRVPAGTRHPRPTRHAALRQVPVRSRADRSGRPSYRSGFSRGVGQGCRRRDRA